MLKTSKMLDHFTYPKVNTMTPIRDYQNDFFHKNDDKLPFMNKLKFSGHPSIKKLRKSKLVNSNKRPASLIFEENESISSKKPNSPSKFEKFADELSLEPQTRATPELFWNAVRTLYQSEEEYVRILDVSFNIYRRTLKENPKFQNQIIKNDSNDELLLFGNIETISSISQIFITTIRNLLADCCNCPKDQFSDEQFFSKIDELISTPSNTSNFDIGAAFNLHFLRIKSTYLSYSVTHKRQMELFDFIQSGNAKIYQEWYETCLKEADMIHLKRILESPITRLNEWVDLLQNLDDNSNSVLSEPLVQRLKETREQYFQFVENVKEETNEYEENEMYNFSLTPMEIIQDYSNKMTQDPNASNSLAPPPKIQAENRVTSSVYSAIPPPNIDSVTPLFSTEMPADLESAKALTLAENILKFKEVYKGLENLNKVIIKTDYCKFIDDNIQLLTAWRSLIHVEEHEETEVTNRIEALKEYKEAVTVWKLTELQIKVLDPIAVMLRNCDTVKVHLKDLQILKKDYTFFLKENSETHDIKRELISKHFEHLQQQLAQQLPQFILFSSQLIEKLIVTYQGLLQKYFQIQIGGNSSLEDNLQKIQTNGTTPNLDILIQYSEERFRTKRKVRDDLQYTTSKTIRKLFEL